MVYSHNSVQFSSDTQSCLTLCDPMDCSSPGFPVHHQLLSFLKLMSIELVMPSNHLILCCPLLLSPSAAGTVQTPNHKAALERTVPRSHHWEDGPSIVPEAINTAQLDKRVLLPRLRERRRDDGCVGSRKGPYGRDWAFDENGPSVLGSHQRSDSQT